MSHLNNNSFDRIIIGAGIYGLYAARESARKGLRTLVLDQEISTFSRGSYVNQARVHNGYHYPRSFSTASKSAQYFDRFCKEFDSCIHRKFQKVYAIASDYSWTSGTQFLQFCSRLGLPCERIELSKYFNPVSVEAAFLTMEFTFDAERIRDKLVSETQEAGAALLLGRSIEQISQSAGTFTVTLSDGLTFSTPYLLNATYAGSNQILEQLGCEPLPIKYELCEVILCNVSDRIRSVGITVMDGPFFSLMPFGKTGLHSLTTVSRTPHETSHSRLPAFSCQSKRPVCTPSRTQNCNTCLARPDSAYTRMRQTARKYLNEDLEITYVKSLFSLKPILKVSEIDDSRPTLVKTFLECPGFYTVFSGKINTVYDLDAIL